MGRRQPCRAGPDDGHRLAVRRGDASRDARPQQGCQFVGVSGHGGHVGLRGREHVGRRTRLGAGDRAGEHLQRANRHRAVGADEAAVVVDTRHLAATARGLAGRAANASTDRRERIRAAGDEVGVLETALGDCADVAAGVGVDRAGTLARDEPGVMRLTRHVHAQGRST